MPRTALTGRASRAAILQGIHHLEDAALPFPFFIFFFLPLVTTPPSKPMPKPPVNPFTVVLAGGFGPGRPGTMEIKEMAVEATSAAISAVEPGAIRETAVEATSATASITSTGPAALVSGSGGLAELLDTPAVGEG